MTESLQFRCRKFDLQNELDAIAPVVDKKSKDEIYSCIYFSKTDSNNLMMAASSRELMVQSSIKINSAGGLLESAATNDIAKTAMAVNADKISALCRKLPDKIIEFTYLPKMLKATVRCDSSVYNLSCQEPTFFPAITEPEEFKYRIPLRFFVNSIKNSIDLITQKESSFAFYNGSLLSLSDKSLEMIATDGNRMALSLSLLETDKSFKVILPKKTLAELLRTMDGSQLQSIDLDVTPNHAYIRFGKYIYRSGIYVGNFPNYRLLTDTVRRDNDIQIRVPRGTLVTALERCLVLIGKDQGYGVNFDIKNQEASLAVANEKSGDSAFEIIPVESDKHISIRLNGQYILQYLNTIGQDEVVDIWVNSQSSVKPIYFKVPSDPNYLFLVQPMERI